MSGAAKTSKMAAALGTFTTVEYGPDKLPLTFVVLLRDLENIPAGEYFIPACLGRQAHRKLMATYAEAGKVSVPATSAVRCSVNDVVDLLVALRWPGMDSCGLKHANKGRHVLLWTQTGLLSVRPGLPWPVFQVRKFKSVPNKPTVADQPPLVPGRA